MSSPNVTSKSQDLSSLEIQRLLAQKTTTAAQKSSLQHLQRDNALADAALARGDSKVADKYLRLVKLDLGELSHQGMSQAEISKLTADINLDKNAAALAFAIQNGRQTALDEQAAAAAIDELVATGVVTHAQALAELRKVLADDHINTSVSEQAVLKVEQSMDQQKNKAVTDVPLRTP